MQLTNESVYFENGQFHEYYSWFSFQIDALRFILEKPELAQWREDVNSKHSWRSILKELGFWDKTVKIRSTGVIVKCCEIHVEKTPSLHLYPDSGFKCYGCGQEGDKLIFLIKFGWTDLESLQNFFSNLPTDRSTSELQLVLPF